MGRKQLLSVSIREGARTETSSFAPLDADLRHARATDPEGSLVAVDEEGRPAGWAAAAVREDAVLLLALEVKSPHRGRGVGSALLGAARAYGASRGARALDVLAPSEPSTLAFLLRAGLAVRSLVLDLTAETAGGPPPAGTSLHAVAAGPSLYGWIASLDRETRGFARPREWARWAEQGHVLSWRRGGRTMAVGAWQSGPFGIALGPIAARTPEGAADFLPLLAARAGGGRFSLALPAEARALLVAARHLGFRAVSTRVLLGERKRGDLRRYAGGGGLFF